MPDLPPALSLTLGKSLPLLGPHRFLSQRGRCTMTSEVLSGAHIRGRSWRGARGQLCIPPFVRSVGVH